MTDDGEARLWHILLVDDDTDSRAIYRTILTYSGFRVSECGDGESAVCVAKVDRPDLILLDLSLPVLDGWHVARLLKQDPDTRGIWIVALTAHALAEERRRAAQAGFDAYLTKPAAPLDVLDEVRHRLRIAAPVLSSANVWSRGDRVCPTQHDRPGLSVYSRS